jgi:ferredoxin
VVVEGDSGLHFSVRARRVASTLQAKPSEEVRQMTYVVVEPCVNCRYTDCAVVCPVEAFHLDDDMLVINPETCIDCDACVPECPVEAIFPEDKVPEEWAHYTQMNAEKSLSGLPTISDKLDPLC